MYYISHGGPGSGRYPLGSGERPYQKYEGGGTIKKGTKLGRVSNVRTLFGGKTWNKKAAYVYDANNPRDKEVYEGAFATNLFRRTAKDPIKYAYETTKDLKIATEADRYNEFVDMFNENLNNIQGELLGDYIELTSNGENLATTKLDAITKDMGDFSGIDFTKKIEKIDSDKDLSNEQKIYLTVLDMSIGYDNQEVSKQYFDRLAKKYDAVIDTFDKDTYNGAENPLIILNPDENLKFIKKEKSPIEERVKNYWYIANRQQGKVFV